MTQKQPDEVLRSKARTAVAKVRKARRGLLQRMHPKLGGTGNPFAAMGGIQAFLLDRHGNLELDTAGEWRRRTISFGDDDLGRRVVA